MNLDISFIIPALNEENCIANTIASIYEFVPNDYQYEIIVVDNGSTDQTQQLATQSGATVYIEPTLKVGAMRNLGVKRSNGRFLIFLDADVRLTPSWFSGISQTIQMLDQNPNIITGSKCGVSNPPSFIEKYWFAPLLAKKTAYINSGHLITTRNLFDQLNGFSNDLITGEDFDFSTRAKELGAKIINNPDLVVIHAGYPNTLKAFMLREIWHGVGDAQSFKSFLNSKVAILASILMVSQLSLLLAIATGYEFITFCSLFVLFSIPIISSYIKYKSENFTYVFINALIFYLYLTSRFFSLFIRTRKNAHRKT